MRKILNENDTFTLFDLQLNEVAIENCTSKQLQKFVYEIMEERSQGIQDSISDKYKAIIEKGCDNLSEDDMFDLLDTYGYELKNRKVN